MHDDDRGLTIEELAEQVGVSVRTVRFYIAQGLLPGPGSRGKSASYGEEHLVRLRLIRQLTEQHVPLAKIHAMLAGISFEEAQALLMREERRTDDLRAAEQTRSPRDYVSALLDDARQARQGGTREKVAPYGAPAPAPPATGAAGPLGAARVAPYGPRSSGREVRPDGNAWYRWELAPGVELHARADARDRHRALIERLVREAGAAADPMEDADPSGE
jgi:DNA-binding transcriptional MerR regulator